VQEQQPSQPEQKQEELAPFEEEKKASKPPS
jgi:hypothetical protein